MEGGKGLGRDRGKEQGWGRQQWREERDWGGVEINNIFGCNALHHQRDQPDSWIQNYHHSRNSQSCVNMTQSESHIPHTQCRHTTLECMTEWQPSPGGRTHQISSPGDLSI